MNGSPEYVRKPCDASLQRLGVDRIDLYYQHRVDKSVPTEDTVSALAGLADAVPADAVAGARPDMSTIDE